MSLSKPSLVYGNDQWTMTVELVKSSLQTGKVITEHIEVNCLPQPRWEGQRYECFFCREIILSHLEKLMALTDNFYPLGVQYWVVSKDKPILSEKEIEQINSYLSRIPISTRIFESEVTHVHQDHVYADREIKQGVLGRTSGRGNQVWVWFLLFLLQNKEATHYFIDYITAITLYSQTVRKEKLKALINYLIMNHDNIKGASFEVILGICFWLYHQYTNGTMDYFKVSGPLTFAEQVVSYTALRSMFNMLSSNLQLLREIALHGDCSYKCTHIFLELAKKYLSEKEGESNANL